ncbi:MAG: AbrB/MazE/SpoVT family DNA-binding domain-containing protein [Anaerolineales bacterium]
MNKKHIGSNFDDFLKEEDITVGIMVKINARNQITIPRDVRNKLNIKQGDRLLVDVQDGVIILIPQPKRYTDYLQGLHSEIWKGVDAQEYVNGEREAWVISTGE